MRWHPRNISREKDEAGIEAKRDLGQWIGDYLDANGYGPHINSTLVKQMILSAFPSISTDEEYTPENIEGALVRSRQVMNEYAGMGETKVWTLQDTQRRLSTHLLFVKVNKKSTLGPLSIREVPTLYLRFEYSRRNEMERVWLSNRD